MIFSGILCNFAVEMKIIVENRIPYIEGVLEPVAEVSYLPTIDITADAVRDADALLVRTRTQCNEALLAGSTVRFIGSATIGTDHIDLDWCRRHGITGATAAVSTSPPPRLTVAMPCASTPILVPA